MPLTSSQYQILILRELGQYFSSPNRTATNAELADLIQMYWEKRDAVTNDERRYLLVKLDAIDALLGMQSQGTNEQVLSEQEGDEKVTYANLRLNNASLLRQVRADLALKLGIGISLTVSLPTRDTPTLGAGNGSEI